MKIAKIIELEICEIKIIRFSRFNDNRGYFTETFRLSQLKKIAPFLENINIVQINESYSKEGVIRGFHFQWNPYMGKLVRTTYGRMVDLFLDIRKGSPTFGMASAYELKNNKGREYDEWIWIPPGFAHGNYFTEESTIEYLCTGEYSQYCEAGISPLAKDINWELCPKDLKKEFDYLSKGNAVITEKDKNGFTMKDWFNNEISKKFLYPTKS